MSSYALTKKLFAFSSVSTLFNTLLMQGFSVDGTAITITITKYDGLGTYSLSFSEESNGTSGLYVEQQDAWISDTVLAGIGTLTINV